MRPIAIAGCLMCALGCGRQEPSSPRAVEPATPHVAAPQPEAQGEPVGFEMRDVRLHSSADIVILVKQLRGHLVSRTHQMPFFDDQRSFYIAVDDAELSIDASSLTALVNRVFDYDGSPLSDLHVAIHDDRLEQKGTLHKGLSVPFSVRASVSSRDGQILLRPEKVSIAGIPASKMLHAFGLELDEVLKVRTGRGVSIRGDDLLLDPSQVIPIPEVRGKVVEARIVKDQLCLTFGGKPAAAAHRQTEARHYVWFRGGQIRFGRMTMTDADLQLIDADPRDPFDFWPERYQQQLVAGYSRNTASGALRTTMPDYDDLPRLASGRLAAPR
jgi:hypothetical protein